MVRRLPRVVVLLLLGVLGWIIARVWGEVVLTIVAIVLFAIERWYRHRGAAPD